MTPDRPVAPLGRRRPLGILIAAVAVAIIPAGAFGWNAIADVGDQLRAGRLREAELLAAQVDQFVNDTFFDLELAAAALAPGRGDDLAQRFQNVPDSPSLDAVTLATLLFDESGQIVDTRPTAFATQRDGMQGSEIASVVAESTSSISPPFILGSGKEVVAALAVPIFASTGDRLGTLVGVIDLSGPVMAGFVEPASRIGVTGHADLVDDRGMVLVSTNPAHVLSPGDHPEFYAEAIERRTPIVRSTPHDAEEGDVDLSSTHVMAWVPLRNAPWAVAFGASEPETMAPVTQLRSTLVATGLASLAVLIVGLAVAFRVGIPTPTTRTTRRDIRTLSRERAESDISTMDYEADGPDPPTTPT